MARTIDRASRVISGTWGQLWLDGELIAEVSGFQAKFTKNKQTINLCGQFVSDTKAMSADGKGSVTLYKVDSGNLVREAQLQNGVDRRYVIISKLADPDSFGAERIALHNVSMDDLTLADWKANSTGEITMPFTFTRYQLMDTITEA